MAERVTIAVIQPPYLDLLGQPLASERVLAEALELAGEAARAGAQWLVLPEYLNAKNASPEEAPELACEFPCPASETLAEICRERGCLALLPLLERRDGQLYNSARLFDHERIWLCYDKVHPTLTERRDWGVTGGHAFPVAETPWGKVGVMTCYDAHFPEAAACLALAGAEAILYPALERSLSREQIHLLVQSRAWDHAVVVARASFGIPAGLTWQPGLMAGESCIAGKDGRLLVSAGPAAGYVTATVDLGAPRVQPRSHGQPPVDIRACHHEDRRPDVYRRWLT